MKNDYNKESYKNIELSDIIESSNDYIKGIMNFISKVCSEGYIPQEKYEEQGILFKNDEGKWINGKYYTKDELEKMKKNNGYELKSFFSTAFHINIFIHKHKKRTTFIVLKS